MDDIEREITQSDVVEPNGADNEKNTARKIAVKMDVKNPATKNPLKKLYYWVLHWAYTPYGI